MGGGGRWAEGQRSTQELPHLRGGGPGGPTHPLPSDTGQQLPGGGVVVNSAALLVGSEHVRGKQPRAASKAQGKETRGAAAHMEMRG